MANYIKSAFNTEMALAVLNDVLYQRSNYYYYLGKLEKWDALDEQPVDPLLDSYAGNAEIRNSMVYVKRISANDVTLVIPRYDWTSGVVYDFWDDAANMSQSKFYVITSDFNVYKCLDNAGGTPSLNEPTSLSIGTFNTDDGYTWKYMYHVPPFKQQKFKSVNYIPVQRALTDSFYNKGSVESVVVTDGGTGYADVALSYITVTPNGAGSGAELVPIITKVARPEELNSDGQVVVPARPMGTIVGVKIISGGTGYTLPPTLTVVDTLGTGVSLYGNAGAVLKAVVFDGSIVNVTIEDPGQLYSSDTDTVITVQGDGLNASFSPVVYNGSVVGVVVENAGTGYSYMILTIVGAGTGATLRPVLAESDFISDQSIIEQTTVSGAIYSIQVVNGGSDYPPETTLTVSGNNISNGDIQCVCEPVIVGGVIQHIVISNPGTNYNYADIVISNNGIGKDAVLRPVLSPYGGHGKDAVIELLAHTLVINTSLWQDSLLNKLSQDYRQYGILKNPTNIITGQTFRDESMLIAYEATFDNVTGLQDLLNNNTEDILTLGEYSFRVIGVDGLTVTLQPLSSAYVVPIGTMVSTTAPFNVYNSLTLVSQPTINKHSGRLLYVSNENAFSFTENQGIVIKTYLNF